MISNKDFAAAQLGKQLLQVLYLFFSNLIKLV